jgi:XTP/dITP diphosphohydrolase
MKRIIIASNNKGKIKEIKAIIGEQDIEILTLEDIGFTRKITEDGHSIKENAIKKGLCVMKTVGELTLADDSGLEVDAINGQPGVFSARFSGQGATDERNNRKLLALLNNIPMEKRGAWGFSIISTPKGKYGIVCLSAWIISFTPEGPIIVRDSVLPLLPMVDNNPGRPYM